MLGDFLTIKKKNSLTMKKRPSMIFSQTALDRLKGYDDLYPSGQKSLAQTPKHVSLLKPLNSELIEKKPVNIFQVVSQTYKEEEKLDTDLREIDVMTPSHKDNKKVESEIDEVEREKEITRSRLYSGKTLHFKAIEASSPQKEPLKPSKPPLLKQKDRIQSAVVPKKEKK